jgi:hypothetical protein
VKNPLQLAQAKSLPKYPVFRETAGISDRRVDEGSSRRLNVGRGKNKRERICVVDGATQSKWEKREKQTL